MVDDLKLYEVRAAWLVAAKNEEEAVEILGKEGAEALSIDCNFTEVLSIKPVNQLPEGCNLETEIFAKPEAGIVRVENVLAPDKIIHNGATYIKESSVRPRDDKMDKCKNCGYHRCQHGITDPRVCSNFILKEIDFDFSGFASEIGGGVPFDP